MSDSFTNNLVEPKYSKNTMMAYIDILGFKELVENKPLPEIVKMMNDIMKADDCVDYKEIIGINTKLISDSFVVWAQLEEAKHIGAFFAYLATMIGKIHKIGNVITRGYLACGEHYCADDLWISPVFVKAYLGEQKFAIHPRVILDITAIERIHFLDKSFLNGNWAKHDTDGFRYINYLMAISGAYKPAGKVITLNLSTVGAKSKENENLINSLVGHRQTILNGLNSNTDVKILSKYIWLANYHNTYIDEDVKLEGKEELKIDLKVILK